MNYVVGNKTTFLVNLKLRNTRLVIDGNSLYRGLYLSSRLDQQHGGDYARFADCVRRFFKVLSFCDIRPFVVLGGSMGHTQNQFSALQHRAQADINAAHALSAGGRGASLPVLGKAVFRQVLSGLEVPFVQCVAEAEREMASLANQWNCAVLTMDSILYILDLKEGCLPTIYFQWDEVKMCKKKAASERCIDAWLFSIDRFCAHFNHMSKDLLPLFAAMALNDSTDLRPTMKTFFAKANIPKRPLQSEDWTRERIDGLLHWLARSPGPRDALARVLHALGGPHSRAAHAHSLLSSGMERYRLTTSNLVPFFTEGAPIPNLPAPVRALPGCVLQAMAKGQLGFFILNAVVWKRVVLHTQVEDFQLPSCNMTSQPIRQVLYGLLLGGRQTQADRRPDEEAGPTDAGMDSGSAHCVQEFARQNLELWSSSVPAVQTKTLLYLERLNQGGLQIRLEVLLDTLGVKESVLPLVPCHLGLPVCVTCYWLTHAQPTPDLQHLHALLLGLVHGELERLKPGGKGKKDLKAVRKRLCQLQVQRQRNGPDPGAAHTFSQWQSCLRMSLLLNQLLCFPLPEPQCAWLYRGTLVHQALKEMEMGKSPEELLQGDDLPGQLYRDLLGAVQGAVGPALFQRKKRRERGTRRQAPNNTLAQECEREDEGEDDGEDDEDQEEEWQCMGQDHMVQRSEVKQHNVKTAGAEHGWETSWENLLLLVVVLVGQQGAIFPRSPSSDEHCAVR
ncbi:hypothetical protein AAFF_G00307960 [Aldrovandia affinis]|uniref:Asteroid domain-containing protein n=1 Tax=Aldrovandia affinis TaxID=143900 RepID=A0AAD7W0T4_9TELE|nr:hypothetical protein AAFF_G00307960 [Aldrovandia affinis]